MSNNKSELDYLEYNVEFLMKEVQIIHLLIKIARDKKSGKSSLSLPKRSSEPNLSSVGTRSDPNQRTLHNLGLTREYPAQALFSPIRKEKKQEQEQDEKSKKTQKLSTTHQHMAFSPIRRKPSQHGRATEIYSPIKYSGRS